ncbi:WD40 repeat domain-containing protein [Streptomyces chartreusis]
MTTSDPAIAASLPPGDTAVRAVERSVACAVHAKGKTALEVAAEIARAASARLPVEVTDLAPDLRTALERTGRSGFTVVIDALDEAAGSHQTREIIRNIARPLAEDLHPLGVRVVVGTRRQDDDGLLLEEFGTPRIIDLDNPPYFSQADLTVYALATLQLHGDERPDNPYNSLKIAESVAERIAQLADRNFLVAGLTARAHGMHDMQPVTTGELDFTPTVDAVLASYLARLQETDSVPAAALMTALAYAAAPGVPLDLWQATITALGHTAPSAGDLQVFARSSAANFLIETSVSDQPTPLYRLFHQALNDAPLRHRDTVRENKAITRALVHLGRQIGWDRAPAYLRGSDPSPHHTASVRALCAVEMSEGRALLASTGADGVVRLWDPDTGTPQHRLEGHSGAVSSLCTVRPPGRHSLLASAGADGVLRLWDPDTGTPQHRLKGHTEWVRALCTVEVSGGRTLLASADADGVVRLWDPVTGTSRHRLKGHTSWVSALCTVRLPDGHTLLASAGDDRTVRLWDGTGDLMTQIPVGGQPSMLITCDALVIALERGLLAVDVESLI